jgi:hypothetical protein
MDPASIYCNDKCITEYNRLRSAFTNLPPLVRGEKPARAPVAVRKVLTHELATCHGAEENDTAATDANNSELPNSDKFLPLVNQGSNSFVNAAAQALLSCKFIRAWAERNADSDLCQLIAPAVQAANDAQSSPLCLDEWKKHINQIASADGYAESFDDGNEHSSYAFLQYLIGSNEELRVCFEYEKVETRTCSTCSKQTTSNSIESELRLVPSGKGSKITWEELLNSALYRSVNTQCHGKCKDDKLHIVSTELHLLKETRAIIIPIEQSDDVRSRIKVNRLTADDVQIPHMTTPAKLKVSAAIQHANQARHVGEYSAVTKARDGSTWIRICDHSMSEMNRFIPGLSNVSYLILEVCR